MENAKQIFTMDVANNEQPLDLSMKGKDAGILQGGAGYLSNSLTRTGVFKSSTANVGTVGNLQPMPISVRNPRAGIDGYFPAIKRMRNLQENKNIIDAATQINHSTSKVSTCVPRQALINVENVIHMASEDVTPPKIYYGSKTRSERSAIATAASSTSASSTSKHYYKCPNCAKLYATKTGMTNHVYRSCAKTDLTKFPFYCMTCQIPFISQELFESHMCPKLGHICQYCGKDFTRAFVLKCHIRNHTGERPYKCDVCQKLFADRSNWRTHMDTHNGVKRHGCPVCKQHFSRLQSLDNHLKKKCKPKVNNENRENTDDIIEDALTLMRFAQKARQMRE